MKNSMTREEIIAAACEIGWDEMGANLYGAAFDGAMALNALERFAIIIERKAAEAEREACAKVCEDFADGTSAYEVHHRFAAYKCADLIRKRGKNESIS